MLLELILIDPCSSYCETIHIRIVNNLEQIIIYCRYYTCHSIVVLTKLCPRLIHLLFDRSFQILQNEIFLGN